MGRKSLEQRDGLKEKMIGLSVEGYTYEQISEICGIDTSTTSKKLRAWGFPSRVKPQNKHGAKA